MAAMGLLTQLWLSARFWFGLSLITWWGMAGVIWRDGQGRYRIQDDARQHVFWMQRFEEPGLFPNDWIADYFQSVAPWGYRHLYELASLLGFDPFSFNKLLPLLLSLLTTVLVIQVSWRLLPVPSVGFVSSVILNLSLWMKDDLVSGTPRAFVVPLLLGFVWGLLSEKPVYTAIAILVTGLFYPQLVLIQGGVLLLQGLGIAQTTAPKRPLVLLGLMTVVLVLSPYLLSSNPWGPVLTREQGLSLAELAPRGRSAFFYEDVAHFWLSSDRSGLIPGYTPLVLWLGGLLPLLLPVRQRFPLLAKLRGQSVLLQLLLSSLGGFVLAHLMLFRLHLPSRYTHHSLRVLLSLAAGIVVVAIAHGIFTQPVTHRLLGGVNRLLALILVFGVVASPLWLWTSFQTAYYDGTAPEIYRYLQDTPNDSLVAGVDAEIDNIPSFGRRPILTGLEYMIPYHWGYYAILRDRFIALIQAQYSPHPDHVRRFIADYDIDYWLIRRDDFSLDTLQQHYWLNRMATSPRPEDPLIQAIQGAFHTLEQGQTPVLATLGDRCNVAPSPHYWLLDTTCILTRFAPET